MTPSLSLENAEPIGRGGNADVYVWGAGQVLKLFFRHIPWQANEAIATMAAYEAGIPVPEVISGLIEVDNREGIVFERIDGPTMNEHIQRHPEELEICAIQSAELLVKIHSIEDAKLIPIRDELIEVIKQAVILDQGTRQAILDTLNGLPICDTLCHGDFHFNNIIMSEQGPIVIDWAYGGREDPLYDYARGTLMLKCIPDIIAEAIPLDEETRKELERGLKEYSDVFCQRYEELRSIDPDRFVSWQMVAAAISLVWQKSAIVDDRRVSLIKAALNGTEHPWLQ